MGDSSGSRPIEIKPTEITKVASIGCGAFAEVFEGKCRGVDCAVKVLHRQDLSDADLEAFRDEVAIMSKLNHPNVVLFMGACTRPGNLMIVTERLPMDLATLLIKKKTQYTLLKKLRMAKDAALGMNWLHSNTPQFIHRDLKLSNLLVTEDHRVKVCDFGLTRIRHDIKEKQEGAQGSPLYMAPEVLMTGKWDEKCDVYSFGLTLWEMIYQEYVFPKYQSCLPALIVAVCERNERPDLGNDLPPALIALMQKCWDKSPKKRPSFAQVIKSLDDIIVDIAIADPEGQKFWQKHYPGDEFAQWNHLCAALEDITKHKPPKKGKDKKMRCLQVLLLPQMDLHARGSVGMTDFQVSMERFGLILDWFGPINSPSGLLNKIHTALQKPWFHGDVGQQEAESRLSATLAHSSGAYLIRFSSSARRAFTLSIQKDSKTKPIHYRINHRPSQETFYFWDEFTKTEKTYPDLQALVDAEAKAYHLKTPAVGSTYQILFRKKKKKGLKRLSGSTKPGNLLYEDDEAVRKRVQENYIDFKEVESAPASTTTKKKASAGGSVRKKKKHSNGPSQKKAK